MANSFTVFVNIILCFTLFLELEKINKVKKILKERALDFRVTNNYTLPLFSILLKAFS